MHVFTLLGDPVRLRIVELLATGEKPVSRLVEIIGPERGIGQPAVSHHLRVLKDAGFVSARTIGKSIAQGGHTTTSDQQLLCDCIVWVAQAFEVARNTRSSRAPTRRIGGSCRISATG